jgi:UDP-glucose 4-epimerase
MVYYCHSIGPRRPGDLSSVYADTTRANAELHWSATRGLDAMMTDLWAWQSTHPHGYSTAATAADATGTAGSS